MKKVVIDLFAGCGGLSTGFEMAGFEIPLAVEKDEWASETYRFNHPKTKVITGDITQITDLDALLPKNVKVDGVIGGPPCQGFSLSGKRDKKDPRNSLFMDFVRFVKHFQPSFFMMENVPGILSMKTAAGEKVVDLIFAEYEKAGYNAHYEILNAAEFGVPQTRTRVIFIGIRKDLPFFPNELHPKGWLLGGLLGGDQITIRDAIMDLPQIEAGSGTEEQDYPMEPQNDYQRWVRGDCTKIYNHIAMRHSDRLIERFKQIKEGQSLKDVGEEHMQRKRGDASVISGKVYSQNNMRPYGDRPSPTIAASFQSNFIHPYLNRNYTAREAARLQSFPDYYVFKGKRTTMSWEKNISQYQQIGNAVPPLLAKAIAENLINYFKKHNK
jgi:DNA (cytosine-5)-methyltransferase 1